MGCWSSARVRAGTCIYIAPMPLFGQAAGVAAGVAAREGVALRDAPVATVQRELRRQGAVVF